MRGHCRRGRGTIRFDCCLSVRAALPVARVDDLRAEGIFFFYLFLSALSCARDNPRGDIPAQIPAILRNSSVLRGLRVR